MMRERYHIWFEVFMVSFGSGKENGCESYIMRWKIKKKSFMFCLFLHEGGSMSGKVKACVFVEKDFIMYVCRKMKNGILR